jgi:glucokinase
MTEVVVADVGGTYARFALAEIDGGRVRSLGEPTTLRTADYAGFEAAWDAFAAGAGRTLPPAAAIAVASPVGGEAVHFTNNPWVIHPAALQVRLGVDALLLVNDFGAVGHAVAQASADQFVHLCGPDVPPRPRGVTTVCGPGTGLGVAQVLREDGGYRVVETEGGHVAFAPLDDVEDALLARLRARFGRASAERVVSGPGLLAIHEMLAQVAGRPARFGDDRALWAAALAGGDADADAALDRFLRVLGAVAGDLALAHGADTVVIAGGLGLRLRDAFAGSGFAERFVAKGRFRAMMAAMPVKLIVHPQPGLFGAAAAFAQRHG